MSYRRYAPRRRATRRPTRRPARRTRTRYRRTTTRRRVMSRKKILNITSEKKRDNMIPVSYTPSGGSPSPGGYTLTGNTTSFMVWNASYRARNIGLDPNITANRP